MRAEIELLVPTFVRRDLTQELLAYIETKGLDVALSSSEEVRHGLRDISTGALLVTGGLAALKLLLSGLKLWVDSRKMHVGVRIQSPADPSAIEEVEFDGTLPSFEKVVALLKGLGGRQEGTSISSPTREQLVEASAGLLAAFHGLHNWFYFAAQEEEYGPFPDDIEAFAQQWLKLQGHDLDYFRRELAEVIIEVRGSTPGERILLILVGR